MNPYEAAFAIVMALHHGYNDRFPTDPDSALNDPLDSPDVGEPLYRQECPVLAAKSSPKTGA